MLDASVLLACEDPDDDHHEHAVRLLTGPDPLATLDLAYYEVTNVAVRVWRDRAPTRSSGDDRQRRRPPPGGFVTAVERGPDRR